MWEFLGVLQEFVKDMIDLFDFGGRILVKMWLVGLSILGGVCRSHNDSVKWTLDLVRTWDKKMYKIYMSYMWRDMYQFRVNAALTSLDKITIFE